jgi:hypothetical protein
MRLACVLLLSLLPLTLSAFEFNRAADGTPVAWNSSVAIAWNVSPDAPESVRSTVVACLDKWSAASDGTLTFVEQSGGICIDYNTGSTLGKVGAFTTNQVLSNQIVSSHIELNAANFKWDGAYAVFLAPTLLHELGHALGLNHPDAKTSNIAGAMNIQDPPTMWPTITLCANTLHYDDIVGIRTLYAVETSSVETTFSVAEKHRGRSYSFESSDAPGEIFWEYGDGTSDTSAVHRYIKGLFSVSAESRGRTGTMMLQVGVLKSSALKKK